MKGLVFQPDGHLYTFEGVEVPSVTTILKELGFAGNPGWYTDEARQRGEFVHTALELYDRGTLDPRSLDPRLEGYLEAWKLWRHWRGGKILKIEEPVYSKTYRYAGKLDRLIVTDRGRTVVDIKSGAPAKWHRLQVAAYAMALGGKLPEALILYLNPNGGYKEVWVNNLARELEDWRCCVRVYYKRRS